MLRSAGSLWLYLMVTIKYKIKDERVLKALHELADLGGDYTPITRDIAGILEESTRERFATETGPDGEAWEPSLRVKLFGGRTLTLDGHLGDSISSDYNAAMAEVGSNRVYAAIHQFGGDIEARGGALHFEFAGRGTGTYVTVQSVTIPARPYLGVSDADADDMDHAVMHELASRLEARL